MLETISSKNALMSEIAPGAIYLERLPMWNSTSWSEEVIKPYLRRIVVICTDSS